MDGTSIILCLFLIFTFLYACLLFYLSFSKLWRPQHTLQNMKRALPIIGLTLSIILIAVSATTRQSSVTSCTDDLKMNNDIGGIGVLLGLFLPPLVLVLVLFGGHFKPHTFGAKELCVAQVANLLYLALNLSKSLLTLHYAELLVACSSADAVSASISMAFSYKDVLAARKLVTLGLLCQLLTFGVLGAALHRIQHYPAAQCAIQIRHPIFDHHYPTLMWVYYIARIILAIVPVYIGYRFSVRLNTMERGSRLGPNVKEARTWATMPATLFTNYFYFFGIFLLHGTAVVFFIPKAISTRESWNALWSEWGQSAAFIIAVFAIIHVVYSFIKLFCDLQEAKDQEAKDDGDIEDPKRKLHSPDVLLFDEKPLHTYAELKAEMTEEDKENVWKELIAAFKEKDIPWIYDCLERAAPVDRQDGRDEFPLHMAARFGNTGILTKIFEAMPETLLLEKNASGETPIQIAVSANASLAVAFLLRAMVQFYHHAPQRQSDINNTIMISFETAINDQKSASLEQLTSWPNWRHLIIPDWLVKNYRFGYGNTYVRFLKHEYKHEHKLAINYFTGKLWSYTGQPMSEGYDWQINSSDENEARDNTDKLLQVLISKSAMTDLEQRDFIPNNIEKVTSKPLGKWMLERLPGPLSSSLDRAPQGKTSRHIYTHALRLGLAETLYIKGADKQMVFVVAAHNGHNDIVQDALKSYIPDTLLDCALQSWRKLDDTNKNALIARGARDWSAFLRAARYTAVNELEQLIANEDAGTLRKMMKAKNEKGQPAFLLIASNYSMFFEYGTPAEQKRVTDCLDLISRHGADPNDVDFDGNTALHIAFNDFNVAIAHPDSESISIAIVKHILIMMGPMACNVPNKRGNTVLHDISGKGAIRYHWGLELFKLSLEHFANPDLKGEDGRSVFQMVEDDLSNIREGMGKTKPSGVPAIDDRAKKQEIEQLQCAEKVLELLEPHRRR